jgi:hypothetical protein
MHRPWAYEHILIVMGMSVSCYVLGSYEQQVVLHVRR